MDGGSKYYGGSWANSVFVIYHPDDPPPEEPEFVCEDDDAGL